MSPGSNSGEGHLSGQAPPFVAAHEVEHRKERLVRIGAVAPVGVRSELVPGRQRRLELVVGLLVVRAVVAGGAQVFGEALDVMGNHRGIGRGHLRGGGMDVRGPHVVRADGDGVQPGDDRRTGRCAYPRRGETVRPPPPLGGEAVHVRCPRYRVAVATVERTGVLKRNPENVRTGSGSHGDLASSVRAMMTAS